MGKMFLGSSVLLISILFLSAIAFSVQVGDVVTQQQVNNQDFSNYDLNFSIDRQEYHSNLFEVYINYTTLTPLANNEFVISREQMIASYSITDYYDCRITRGFSKSSCLAEVKASIIKQAKGFRYTERERLTSLKTPDWSEINDAIVISDEELG